MQLPPPEADFEQMSEEEIALTSSIMAQQQANDPLEEDAQAYQDAFIVNGVPVEEQVRGARYVNQFNLFSPASQNIYVVDEEPMQA
jgi:hypothetical protein